MNSVVVNAIKVVKEAGYMYASNRNQSGRQLLIDIYFRTECVQSVARTVDIKAAAFLSLSGKCLTSGACSNFKTML